MNPTTALSRQPTRWGGCWSPGPGKHLGRRAIYDRTPGGYEAFFDAATIYCAHYDCPRGCEIAAAWARARADVAADRFRHEGAETHRSHVEHESADAV